MRKLTIVDQIDADGQFIMVKVNGRLEKCWAYKPGSTYSTKFKALKSAILYCKAITETPQTKILREYEIPN
jgi:hypothetical protein